MSDSNYPQTHLASTAEDSQNDLRKSGLSSPKIDLLTTGNHSDHHNNDKTHAQNRDASEESASHDATAQENPSLDHNYGDKPSVDPHLSLLGNHMEDANIDKMTFTEDGLDQEIQRAIAEHDLQQQQLQQGSSSASGQMLQNQKNHIDNISSLHYDHLQTSQMDQDDEKQHLQMIADELKRATSSDKLASSNNHFEHSHGDYGTLSHSSFDHQHPSYESGPVVAAASAHAVAAAAASQPSDNSTVTQQNRAAHIPADSELLATNTALAAYNALSSHVPPVALLASVHLAALPLPIVAPDYLPARIQLLIGTLPVLDNLATQLLRYFAVGPYQKIIDLASSPDTAQGAAFRDLASLFEVTKRLYSEEDPFITVEHLAPGMWKEGDKTLSVFRNREQSIESTLRKVNLATFLAATLGLLEAGFFHLNEAFLSVFCPLNNLDPANSMSNMSPSNMSLQSNVNAVIGDKVGKIFKPQATLYLDLKTQAFISGLVAGERSREAILEDVFPSNLEEVLLERRGVKTLSPTEIDFVNRCKSRKDTLLKSESENFGEQFEWFAFLKDLFDLVCKDMSILIWGKKTRSSASRVDRSIASSRISSQIDSSLTPHSDEALQNLSGNLLLQESVGNSAPSIGSPPVHGPDSNDLSNNQEIKDITAGLLPSEIQEQQIHLRINPGISGRVPNRRPWTREEEKALRYALELKGPHWSTILELFGQGGQINESLKNRTQVQLKDKARNWKMFFLKSRLPVPEYLKKVTGDLDRDDKLRAKTARTKKTAAAPVPTMQKRDSPIEDGFEAQDTSKRHKA
ncbi:hypothetical protein PUMCH_003530 [Australozyma saopauloensis]|uniref:Transcription factor TBF1 n=1 Tax=Australozyma saopauloensis TaxID=291208 RepID=A0AAX4HD20_9ASCO|nr:hypothetical protein PUMCH_003530 [[Candida] saopauloensis]